jgi:hypothetical protein
MSDNQLEKKENKSSLIIDGYSNRARFVNTMEINLDMAGNPSKRNRSFRKRKF